MVRVKKLFKDFQGFKVIQDLNLDFQPNKIHCIFGPSGCGKTTLVNIISGLIRPSSGEILGLNKRTFSYIFQEDRLLPWATVEENILLVLENIYNKEDAKEITQHYLSLVNLEEFKNAYPHQLSGGMKQRVSIARAFAYNGDVFIMDEPFKGIDFETKKKLMDYLIDFWEREKKLFILITHDINEALYMADIIHVFQGPPLTLKEQIKINIPHSERKVGNIHLERYKVKFNGNL